MCFKKPDTANIDWVAARGGTNYYSKELKKLVEDLLVKSKDWTKDGCEVILKELEAVDEKKEPEAVDEKKEPEAVDENAILKKMASKFTEH
jgi:hypothetical protein